MNAVGRHTARTAFMEPNRDVEVLGRRPERLVIGVVDHLVVCTGWGAGSRKAPLKPNSFLAKRISSIACSLRRRRPRPTAKD